MNILIMTCDSICNWSDHRTFNYQRKINKRGCLHEFFLWREKISLLNKKKINKCSLWLPHLSWSFNVLRNIHLLGLREPTSPMVQSPPVRPRPTVPHNQPHTQIIGTRGGEPYELDCSFVSLIYPQRLKAKSKGFEVMLHITSLSALSV